MYWTQFEHHSFHRFSHGPHYTPAVLEKALVAANHIQEQI